VKLMLAGRDRTDDVGADVEVQARALSDPELESLLRGEQPVLDLGAGCGGPAYIRHFTQLVRIRTSVDTAKIRVPEGHGFGGGLWMAFRRLMWRIMRFAHDDYAFRQNTVNTALGYGLEFESEERRREGAELRQRIDQLERLVRERGAGGA